MWVWDCFAHRSLSLEHHVLQKKSLEVQGLSFKCLTSYKFQSHPTTIWCFFSFSAIQHRSTWSCPQFSSHLALCTKHEGLKRPTCSLASCNDKCCSAQHGGAAEVNSTGAVVRRSSWAPENYEKTASEKVQTEPCITKNIIYYIYNLLYI